MFLQVFLRLKSNAHPSIYLRYIWPNCEIASPGPDSIQGSGPDVRQQLTRRGTGSDLQPLRRRKGFKRLAHGFSELRTVQQRIDQRARLAGVEIEQHWLDRADRRRRD